MTETKPNLSILDHIFYATFWNNDVGEFHPPITLEEAEARLNQVAAHLLALYKLPPRGVDGPAEFHDATSSVADQAAVDAFYAREGEDSSAELERVLGPLTTRGPVLAHYFLPTVGEAREAILRQLGATKVDELPTKQPGSLKFSLNVPALERLIGGNSELEIELRKSIVQEFAKRHLTSVAKEMMAVLKGDMQKVVTDLFNSVALQHDTRAWHTHRMLTPELAKEVKAHVTELVRTEVDKTLQGHVDAALARVVPDISSKVQSTIDREVVLQARDKVWNEVKKTLGG